VLTRQIVGSNIKLNIPQIIVENLFDFIMRDFQVHEMNAVDLRHAKEPHKHEKDAL
jgi:hypothetical protein